MIAQLAEPMQTAIELRDGGMALVDDAEPPAWKAAADEAIATLSRLGVPFSAEDVRLLAGDPKHPAAFGPRMQAAVRCGVIEPCGYSQGTRPLSRARLLRLYRGRG